jgi:hypothetical protein
MLSLIALLLAAPALAEAGAREAPATLLPSEPLVAVADEREAHFVPALRERSKKETWLVEKAWRPDVHVRDADLARTHRHDGQPPRRIGPPNVQAEARLAEAMAPIGTGIQPVTTLFNIWNREAMPLIAGQPYKRRFQAFLRDHYTAESTQADTRLAGILAAAAIRFHAPRVEIVSGYRSPKYNLMLRKKGHQVARESQHTQGNAVDFRIHGVATEVLREFVRGLRMGGVGFYPRTHFVHADTGKIRYWQGS